MCAICVPSAPECSGFPLKCGHTGKLEGTCGNAKVGTLIGKSYPCEVWYSEMVGPANSNPRNIRRVLDKDVIPVIRGKQVAEVTVADVLAITDRIKNRGADQMALTTHNVMKRLFSFAIARQVATFNPAAAIEAKFIATAKSRDVALIPDDVGRLLRAISRSTMKRAQKLTLHLLILCMVRKSELIDAQ